MVHVKATKIVIHVRQIVHVSQARRAPMGNAMPQVKSGTVHLMRVMVVLRQPFLSALGLIMGHLDLSRARQVECVVQITHAMSALFVPSSQMVQSSVC